MAFGVRNTPVDDAGNPAATLYACPNCGATFPATNQGKRDFKQHIKDHERDVP
ncbi:MAG: hypothetical protein O2V44_06970 [Candidatus Bathyarchaeota archaeon]|nr:hypothetical protein [Candidatus Bathyarchaeota archaeon]